jgi:hypothetical protein
VWAGNANLQLPCLHGVAQGSTPVYAINSASTTAFTRNWYNTQIYPGAELNCVEHCTTCLVVHTNKRTCFVMMSQSQSNICSDALVATRRWNWFIVKGRLCYASADHAGAETGRTFHEVRAQFVPSVRMYMSDPIWPATCESLDIKKQGQCSW